MIKPGLLHAQRRLLRAPEGAQRRGQEHEPRRGPRAEERPEPPKPPHPVTLRIKPAASTAATVQDSAPQRVIAAPCRSASAATSPGTTQPIPSDGGTNGARARRTASASSMAAPTRSRPYSPRKRANRQRVRKCNEPVGKRN